MKRFFLLIICLVAGISASYSQEKADISAGMSLNYGSDTSLGIGAKLQYNFTDQIRVEPEFNYFFKHDYVKFWDTSLNIHYLFPLSDKFVVYPLAGLGYAHAKADVDLDFGEYGEYSDSASSGDIQFKVGAGAEYRLCENLKIFVEPKVQLVDDYNQFIFTTGVSYCF